MGTKVRILAGCKVDGQSYQPDQVVDLPASLAKALAADGTVDPHKDAVGYCMNELGAVVIVHAASEETQTGDLT